MKKFQYTKHHAAVTLNVGTKDKPKAQDVIFHKGKIYELPEDNAYIKTLIATGHLKEIDQQSKQEIQKNEKIENNQKGGK